MQTIIGALDKLLGEGTSSWVYSLKNSQNAIKISKNGSCLIAQEYQIMSLLSKHYPSLFPDIVSKQSFLLRENQIAVKDEFHQQNFQCLVMQRLGISIEELINIRGSISLQTIVRIGHQVLNQISALIEQGISHNDIKPANVMFGFGQKRSKVYLIDYGFASIYNDKYNTQDSTFRGNLPFCATEKLLTNHFSVNNDLQSFIYLMIWVLRDGNIPWQQTTYESFPRVIKDIIEKRAEFIKMTLQVMKYSANKRDVLLHQLVLILSLLQQDQKMETQILLRMLKTLF